MSQPKSSDTSVEVRWETPRCAGAVAIGRLISHQAIALDNILLKLTGRDRCAVGRIVHTSFADIDDGLLVRFSPTSAWIMPHGGPRIVGRIDGWLLANGAAHAAEDAAAHAAAHAAEHAAAPNSSDSLDSLDSLDHVSVYPEAASFEESLALAAIARAASPRAIPLLLAQPARLKAALAAGWRSDRADEGRSHRLRMLLNPPRVVAIGAANVGKSSLLNAVAGRTIAIAMDFAGTTRDTVAARVELDGLVVDWFDTPGIRDTDDPVEAAAQAIAQRLRATADVILEISAPNQPCPRIETTAPRVAICTRIDQDRAHQSSEARGAVVHVSATEHSGLEQLARIVRRAIVCDQDLQSEEPWIFDTRLIKAPC